MLINLVPDFFSVLQSTDPVAAYQRYFETHRPLLEAYWHNYVLDPSGPHFLDVVRELESFGARVHVHDPLADAAECEHEYGRTLTAWDALPAAHAIVAAVAHAEYAAMGLPAVVAKLRPGGVFADVKCAYDAVALRAAGARVWRL